jgi:hypothetical protein
MLPTFLVNTIMAVAEGEEMNEFETCIAEWADRCAALRADRNQFQKNNAELILERDVLKIRAESAEQRLAASEQARGTLVKCEECLSMKIDDKEPQ